MAKQKPEAEVENPEIDSDTASETHITMYRDPEFFPAPHTAHVHVDEVMNFSLGGWRTEKEMKHEAEARAKADVK